MFCHQKGDKYTKFRKKFYITCCFLPTWISGFELKGDFCRFLFCFWVLTQGTFTRA